MIRIPAPLLADINAQALASYPAECCGLLVGTFDSKGDALVHQVIASPNVAAGDRPDRFEVDPQVRFDVMKACRHSADSTAIIGHYHSHPDHPSHPSPTDIDMAFEPELIWLITAVELDSVGITQAWRLNRDSRTVESIELFKTP